MIKLGIAGKRGLHYIQAFLDMRDVKVEAFCEVDEKVLTSEADKYNIPKRYRLFEDLCGSSVDAIFIATPMQTHIPQTLMALQAGKHVLSEVTAGVTMDELFWLKEAVERTDKVYMMNENFCYRPDVILTQAMVDRGMFGEPYYAETEYLEDLKSWLLINGQRKWREYWQVGKRGAFYPTHSIGPVLRWFGNDPVDEVFCFGRSPSYTEPRFRQEDTNVTIVKLKSGKIIRMRIDCLSTRPTQVAYFGLQGTRGTLETGRGNREQKGPDRIFFHDGSVNDSRTYRWEDLWKYSDLLPEEYRNLPEGAKQFSFEQDGDYSCMGGDYFVVQDFIRAVRGEKPSPVNVYEACEWTAVGLLSELSIQNGGRGIKMPNFRGKKEELIVRV